jgi:protein-S-isoprenylcysteine O-methyltransferase Ste14
MRIAIGVVWVVFWVYWLMSATRANASVGGPLSGFRRGIGARLLIAVAIVLMVRGPIHAFRGGNVHSTVVMALGLAVVLAGLAFAVWARLHLGRNWGMPMTERAEPELVTSGPYRYVRHPIYSGILLGMIGTAVALNLYGLLIAAVLTAYFIYSARIEEGNMTAAFPTQYPEYRKRSKMLIPFVL